MLEFLSDPTSENAVLSQVVTVLSILFFLDMAWFAGLQFNLLKNTMQNIARDKDLKRSTFGISILVGIIVSLIFATELSINEFPLALGLGIGVAIAFLNSIAAFSLYLTLIILRPWEILPTNNLISMIPKVSAFLVVSSLVARTIREKKINIFWTKECSLLTAFAGWVFLTGQYSSSPADSTAMFLETIGKAVVLFLLITNLIKEKEDSKYLENVLVGGIMSLSILIIFYSILNTSDDPNQRLAFVGLLGDPNDISSITIMGLPFALRPLWQSKSNLSFQQKTFFELFNWLIAIIYTICFFVILYLAQSRGAILATAVFVGMYFMFRSQWSRKSFIIGITCVILAMPLSQLMSSRESSDMSQSGTNRIIYWMTAVRMAIRHPLLGVGFNDFPSQYDSYVADAGSTDFGKRTAHSSWFLILAENGFLGLLLFVSLFVLCFKRAYHVRHLNPEYLFSIGSYGVAMSFLSHSYFIFPYILFAIITVSLPETKK